MIGASHHFLLCTRKAANSRISPVWPSAKLLELGIPIVLPVGLFGSGAHSFGLGIDLDQK